MNEKPVFVLSDYSSLEELVELYMQLSADTLDPVYVIHPDTLWLILDVLPSFSRKIPWYVSTKDPHLQWSQAEESVQLYIAHSALDNMVFENNLNVKAYLDRLEVIKCLSAKTGITESPCDLFHIYQKSPLQALFSMKIGFLNSFRGFVKQIDQYHDVPLSHSHYQFTQSLRCLIADEIRHIVLYGSSTKGRLGNDFDLLIVLDTLTLRTYQMIQGAHLHFHPMPDRPVRITLIPQDYLEAYLSIDPHNHLKGAEVISGEALRVPLYSPNVPLYLCTQVSKYIRLIEHMSWVYHNPEYYLGNPHILTAYGKLPAYLFDALCMTYGSRLDRLQIDLGSSGAELDAYQKTPFMYRLKALLSCTQIISSFQCANTGVTRATSQYETLASFEA